MNRVVRVLIGVSALLALGVSSASADYPAGGAALAASNGSPFVGEAFVLKATNFNPGSVVTFTGSTLGQAVADGVGTASITVNARTTPGPWLIKAECNLPCTRTASTTVIVRERGGTIPQTGSDSTLSTLQLGAIAVAAGGALIGLAAFRRRRLVAA